MLFSLIAMLAPAYDIHVVFEREFDSLSNKGARVTVLTDTNLVAGLLASRFGLHGEPFDSKPFAWEKGRLTWLPLGKFEYGEVHSGTDSILVGTVTIDRKDRAAKWTRDAKNGWAGARLETLSNLPSSGRLVDSAGNCYIIEATGDALDDKVVKRIGPAGERTWRVRSFIPLQVGRDGTIWGYRYGADDGGGGAANQSAARLTDDGVEVVQPMFRVYGFNSLGDHGGEEAGKFGPAVAYVKGERVQIDFPKQIRGCVTALNDHGDLVGEYSTIVEPGGGAFLHSKGMITHLPSPDSKTVMFRPSKINARGVIAGTLWREGKTGAYLYVPKN